MQQALTAATPTLAYHSNGHCLIIGEIEFALEQCAALAPLHCTVVQVSPEQALTRQHTEEAVCVLQVPELRLSGHLGQFDAHSGAHVLATLAALPQAQFDLILDLGDQPILNAPLLPPGYFAPRSEAELARALVELPELLGRFERPIYNALDPQRCAHSRRGQSGCQACLQACEAEAIQSAGDSVQVDPYLCHGCGGCASVCPSGAMRFADPSPETTRAQLRNWLAETPAHTVVFVAEEHAAEVPAQDGVLLVAVTSVASIGVETAIELLALGVGRVLWAVARMDDHDGLLLQQQVQWAQALLAPLEIAEQALCVSDEPAHVLSTPAPSAWVEQPARYTPQADKRLSLRLSVAHLTQSRALPSAPQPLPQGAPYGAIRVDAERCTLCMSCTNVCPSGALLAGGQSPTLNFIEDLCVQCGLCRSACPEQAVSRAPRFVYDAEQARRKQVLYEDQPFACVRCQKVFAPSSVIQRMTSKLQHHPMFQDPKALARLQMCEDCRVIDMVEKESATV